MKSTLDSFQLEVLEAFFRRERGFFLTGGGALAGFHLGHRTTKDLDLFTAEDRLEAGVAALYQVASELGAAIEATRTSPDFRRFLVQRQDDSVVIDLVHDPVPQLYPEKPELRGIKVDPPEEILANKLCTALSRGEIRDLIDLRALELAGYRIEDLIDRAALKDGGLTPAQLAWVLSQIEIGDDARLPGGVSVPELRSYLVGLQDRLTRMALPAEG